MDFAWAEQLWLYAITATLWQCAGLAERAKITNPKLRVLVGGPHTRGVGDGFLMQFPQFDVVCFDPQPATTLIAAAERPFQMPGCIIRNGARTVCCPPAPYQRYSEQPDHAILPGEIQDYYINVSTSTGCVRDCEFCVDGSSLWRYREMREVKQELAFYDARLHENSLVHFYDTVFTAHRKRCVELCRYLSHNLHANYYSCDIEAGHLSVEVVEALRTARIRIISIGFESCNDDILEVIGKRVGFQECAATAELVKNYMPNTVVKAYWLLGLPGTTPKTLEAETLAIEKLLRSGVVDIVSVKLFVPYPGSRVYEDPGQYQLEIRTHDYRQYDRYKLPPVCFPKAVGPNILGQALLKCERLLTELYAERLNVAHQDFLGSDRIPRRYNGPLYVG